MNSILRAALGIGSSTMVGTACGFMFSRVPRRWNDAVTAFAAGVMLAATMFGLFAPAIGAVQGAAVALLPAGAVCGVLFLRAAAWLTDRCARGASALSAHPELLFVLALAIHKFPEGMAGGVGLNELNRSAARMVVVGISLQNLPEGAVMIPPLLEAGVSRRRAACIAAATGLLNAGGVFAGALWGRLAAGFLPFVLAFAGGAMLEVIVAQMIPQACASACLRRGAWIVMGGFLLMVCIGAAF